MNPAATRENSTDYVATIKRNGASDEAVIAILRNAGWPEKEAVAALAGYYETLTGVAPPVRARSIGGPREAFLHLLAFITLSTWCIAAGSLWFTLVDMWFPDPAAPHFGDPLGGMAWNIAALLVAFPVFLLVMRTVWRELKTQPEQADSGVRRWLTYVALLAAAASLIADLVVFVEHLLRGEMGVSFAAKVAVVLVLAGGVFYFLLHSVQPGNLRIRGLGRIFALASGGFVVLTLVLSFVMFGSPSQRRLYSFDDRRSEDLERIAAVIHARWNVQGAASLPPSLASLPESATMRLADPGSGAAYHYEPLGGARYRLCATFQTDTTRLPLPARRSVFRVHPAGPHCFEVDALLTTP